VGVLEVAADNVPWMVGNTFLAWSAVLFALHLRGTPAWQQRAAWILVSSVAVILAMRLGARGGFGDQPVRALVVLGAVVAASVVWSSQARAGATWARWIGYVGVLAFAPNAPYVLTDLFHFMQNVRQTGSTLASGVVFAVQYGWFLVLGAASWVVLLDMSRQWLARHGARVRPVLVLVPTCLVMAFGIYLGRIERFHSWHPLQDPAWFLGRIGNALTSPGPVGFTLAWAVAIGVVGTGGLRLLDATRRAGAGARAVLGWTAWALSGVLLASTPLVSFAYELAGPDVARTSPGVTIACAFAGVLLATAAVIRLRSLLGHAPVRAHHGVAVAAFVPIAAVALSIAASAQWYAQFRGLCEYGPIVLLHGDSCG